TTGTFAKWEVTYVTANGETTAGPANATGQSVNNKTETMTIPTSPDAATTSRNIYRNCNGGAFGLVGSVAGNITTTFNDSTVSPTTAPPGSNTATTNTNNATITGSLIAGATSYRIYRGTSSGGENAYQTTATSPFTDTGAAGTSQNPPTRSTVSQLG